MQCSPSKHFCTLHRTPTPSTPLPLLPCAWTLQVRGRASPRCAPRPGPHSGSTQKRPSGCLWVPGLHAPHPALATSLLGNQVCGVGQGWAGLGCRQGEEASSALLPGLTSPGRGSFLWSDQSRERKFPRGRAVKGEEAFFWMGHCLGSSCILDCRIGIWEVRCEHWSCGTGVVCCILGAQGGTPSLRVSTLLIPKLKRKLHPSVLPHSSFQSSPQVPLTSKAHMCHFESPTKISPLKRDCCGLLALSSLLLDVCSAIQAAAKLAKAQAGKGAAKGTGGAGTDKKETPQERLKRLMSLQLKKQSACSPCFKPGT